MFVALAGGVGAARLLSGLVQVTDPAQITAVVNTGDDMVLHGLHISPDIDTVTYTLAGRDNKETGWGLAEESWVVMEELASSGGQAWFRLGDRDLATHLYRTQRLAEGATLSEVTAELASARGVRGAPRPGLERPGAHPAHPGRARPRGPGRGVLPGLLRAPAPRRGRAPRPLRGGRRRPAGTWGARGGRPGRADRGLPVEPGGLHRPAAGRARGPGRPRGPAARRGRRLPHRGRCRPQGAGRPAARRARPRVERRRGGPPLRPVGRAPW